MRNKHKAPHWVERTFHIARDNGVTYLRWAAVRKIDEALSMLKDAPRWDRMAVKLAATMSKADG